MKTALLPCRLTFEGKLIGGLVCPCGSAPARFPVDGTTFEELLASADARMYRDKAGRRSRNLVRHARLWPTPKAPEPQKARGFSRLPSATAAEAVSDRMVAVRSALIFLPFDLHNY
jgi:hypothetical protein